MDKMQPIGVLDSGVGGLSVLKCLHQMLPYEDFIYVGDTARTPYGTRSEQEIRGFVGEIIDWLAAKNVKQVVSLQYADDARCRQFAGDASVRGCRDVQGGAAAVGGQSE